MKITQDTRAEVQSHLAGEDKGWVFTSIGALAALVVTGITALVFLILSLHLGLWIALGAFALSAVVFIAAIRKGVKTMTDRGVDLVEIGRQTVYGEDDAPQTIAEAAVDNDGKTVYNRKSDNTTHTTERG